MARCSIVRGTTLCIEELKGESDPTSAAPARRGNWLLDVSYRTFAPEHPGVSLRDMAKAVCREFPDGVDAVLIVPAGVPGWRAVVEDTEGSGNLTAGSSPRVAILIGLLLPAVQKVRDAAARNRSFPLWHQTIFTNDTLGRSAGYRHPDLFLKVWVNSAGASARREKDFYRGWIELN